MIIQSLEIGNEVLVNFRNGVYARCIIEQLDKEKSYAELKEIDKDDSTFKIIRQDQWDMVEGIPFEQKHLVEYGFFEDSSYQVYGLPDKGAFVRSVPVKASAFPYIREDILVRRESGGWVLVRKDYRAKFGCRLFLIPYLHVFQNYLAWWYGL